MVFDIRNKLIAVNGNVRIGNDPQGNVFVYLPSGLTPASIKLPIGTWIRSTLWRTSDMAVSFYKIDKLRETVPNAQNYDKWVELASSFATPVRIVPEPTPTGFSDIRNFVTMTEGTPILHGDSFGNLYYEMREGDYGVITIKPGYYWAESQSLLTKDYSRSYNPVGRTKSGNLVVPKGYIFSLGVYFRPITSPFPAWLTPIPLPPIRPTPVAVPFETMLKSLSIPHKVEVFISPKMEVRPLRFLLR